MIYHTSADVCDVMRGAAIDLCIDEDLAKEDTLDIN